MNLPSCRVIFSGTRHFYSCDSVLDIRLIEYPKNDCVEVIVFNSAVGLQYPSLYFKFSTVKSKVLEEEVVRAVAAKKAEFHRSKVPVDVAVLTEAVRAKLECQYVMSLLDIEGNISQPGCCVVISKQHPIHSLPNHGGIWAHKPSMGDLFYMSPSQLHVPTSCLSAEEEDFELSQRMEAAIVRRYLDIWQHLLKKRAKKHHHHHHNNHNSSHHDPHSNVDEGHVVPLPRKRWLRSIRRVLNQLLAAKVRARIVELFGPSHGYYFKEHHHNKMSKQTSNLRRSSGASATSSIATPRPTDGSAAAVAVTGHQRRLSLESYQLIQSKQQQQHHMQRQHTAAAGSLASEQHQHLLPPLDRALSGLAGGGGGGGRRHRRLSSDSVTSLTAAAAASGRGNSSSNLTAAGAAVGRPAGLKHQRSFSAGGTGLPLQLEEHHHNTHSCSSISEEPGASSAAAAFTEAGAAPLGSLVRNSSSSHLSKMLSLRELHHGTPKGTPHGSPKSTPRRLSPINLPSIASPSTGSTSHTTTTTAAAAAAVGAVDEPEEVTISEEPATVNAITAATTAAAIDV